MDIRQKIQEEMGDDDVPFLFLDGKEYDKAIAGVAMGFGGMRKIIYNYDKIIQILRKDMSLEEAEEYFDYNILGSHMGDATPYI